MQCGASLFKQVKEEGNLWPILRIGRPHLRPQIRHRFLTSNLKKVQSKPKAKNALNKFWIVINLRRRIRNIPPQSKGGGNNANKEVLAEILMLLQKLAN
ncbi:unnamed protein product [Rhizophagus irregularis]|nr:unnamed protein product [Rhizophagus irregularis]